MKKIILSFFLLLFSCQNEYIDFHRGVEQQVEIKKELSNFSLTDIEEIKEISLISTPDTDFLEDLALHIEQAQKRVYLEVYILTEKRIKKALKNAKQNGVDVKVILEKNVYLAGHLNRESFEELQKAGIEVIYSNPENYALNHTKMMIVDDDVFISTGNYSYSTFKYNREFFLYISSQEYRDIFEKLFLADFKGKKQNIYHPNVVLSPFSTRTQYMTLLKSAKKSIQMYLHNFSDREVFEILKEQKNAGVSIELIFPDLKKVGANENILRELQSEGIDFVMLSKPEVHAKTILIDGEYLAIGSVNFSPQSMDRNREMGILIKDKKIIDEFLIIFKNDFGK